MSRYSHAAGNSQQPAGNVAGNRQPTQRRNGRGYVPPPITRSPDDTPREIDSQEENLSGSRSRKRIPKPLRFFPHIFPVPTTLYGVITIIIGALLIGLLVFEMREIVSPLLVALAIAIIFYPFRREPKLRPLLLVTGLFFLIWFCLTAMSVLFPFVVAFLLAYIADPLVSYASKRWYVKRWISALVLTLLFVGLIAVAMGYMAPVLVTQVGSAVSSIDGVTKSLMAWIHDGGLHDITGLPQAKIDDMVTRFLLPRLAKLDTALIDAAGDVGKSAPGYLTSFLHFMMIPFVMFYFIKDYWRIRGAIYSFMPQEYHKRSQRFLRDLDEVVGGYLRGDMITSVFQGTFVGVGLYIIGVPGALLLGVITGFLCLIPFIGGYIAYALAAMAALGTDNVGLSLLWVTILFVAQAIVESTVIGPQVMGRHTDLHPILVIMSLLVFGYFMGIGGMLIAIPVSSILIRFANRWRDQRRTVIEQRKVEADLLENPSHARRGDPVPTPAS